MSKELTFVEISQQALLHNYKELKKTAKKNNFLAPTLKSNAYGHGLELCAKILQKEKPRFFVVDSFLETEKILSLKTKIPILQIGFLPQEDFTSALENEVSFVFYRLDLLKKLNQSAKKVNKKAKIHLKIDTGMHRQGILLKELNDFLLELKKYEFIQLQGLMTHFSSADENKQKEFTLTQIKTFNAVKKEILKQGFSLDFCHCANSAGTILQNEFPLINKECNLYRFGISLYGLWPSSDVAKEMSHKINLKPVMKFVSLIIQIKEIKKGSFIGYGNTFCAQKKMRIALIPAGYFEGIFRNLSSNGEVEICQKKAKILGRVSMNLTVVDISNIPQARVGSRVIIFGGKVSADEVAQKAGTINYEITTRISAQIPHLLVD